MDAKQKFVDELKHSEEIKQAFDLWVLNFDIKDGVGGRPDWFSLCNALQYEILKKIILIEKAD